MIRFEQLIAGGLSIFKKLEASDIEILTTMLKKKYDKSKTISRLFDYISIEHGTLLVRENLGIDEKELTSDLRIIAGTETCEFLDSLDLELFVLRKLSERSNIDEDTLEEQFSPIECQTIKQMINKQLLSVTWNDDIPSEDYHEIKITQLGHMKLFCDDYVEDIAKFEDELTKQNYEPTLLPDFLQTQDLSKPAYEVLTINNFLDFCSTYDRCALSETTNSKAPEVAVQKIKNNKN